MLAQFAFLPGRIFNTPGGERAKSNPRWSKNFLGNHQKTISAKSRIRWGITEFVASILSLIARKRHGYPGLYILPRNTVQYCKEETASARNTLVVLRYLGGTQLINNLDRQTRRNINAAVWLTRHENYIRCREYSTWGKHQLSCDARDLLRSLAVNLRRFEPYDGSSWLPWRLCWSVRRA